MRVQVRKSNFHKKVHRTATVFVAPVDKPNEVERWRVTAEAVVNYSAGRLESQEKT